MMPELHELLALVEKKYPQYGRFVKLVLYLDGSGFIFQDEKELFEFCNIEELVAHLENRKPNPVF